MTMCHIYLDVQKTVQAHMVFLPEQKSLKIPKAYQKKTFFGDISW